MDWILGFIRWLFSILMKTVSQMSSPQSVSLSQTSERIVVPESVNFHFTRQCNYQCQFILIHFNKKKC